MNDSVATQGRWLLLPCDNALYPKLDTRFLPLDSLAEELESRQFSGFLEIENTARAFWLQGQFLGALLKDDSWKIVTLQHLAWTLHDVVVAVYTLSSDLTELAWRCSISPYYAYRGTLVDAEQQLHQVKFSGTLRAICNEGISDFYWHQGALVYILGAAHDSIIVPHSLEAYPASPYDEQLLLAPIPVPAATRLTNPAIPQAVHQQNTTIDIVTESEQVAPAASTKTSTSTGSIEGLVLPADPVENINSKGLVRFWNDVLQCTGDMQQLEGAWRNAALQLTDTFPCLDPFGDELQFHNGKLSLLRSVPFEELQKALFKVYRRALARLDWHAKDFDFSHPRQYRTLWRISGMKALTE